MRVLQCDCCGCMVGFSESGDHNLYCDICGHGQGDARKLVGYSNVAYWGKMVMPTQELIDINKGRS